MMNDLPQLLSRFGELPFTDQDDVLALMNCLEPRTSNPNSPTILFKKKYDPPSLQIIAEAYSAPPYQLDRFFRGLLPIVQSERVVLIHLLLDPLFSISLFHFTADVVLQTPICSNCSESLVLLHGDIEARIISDEETLMFDLAFSDCVQFPEQSKHLFTSAGGTSCISVCQSAQNIDPGYSIGGAALGKRGNKMYFKHPLSARGSAK